MGKFLERLIMKKMREVKMYIIYNKRDVIRDTEDIFIKIIKILCVNLEV